MLEFYPAWMSPLKGSRLNLGRIDPNDAVPSPLLTVRPFGKVTGEIHAGTTVNVLMGLWRRLGVKDEAKALEAIELAKQVEAMDGATRGVSPSAHPWRAD